MAKVKIQGNASGTGVLTVTAPNTSTDRTVTLPDATGTLLMTDGSGASLTGVGGDLSFGGDTFGANKTIGSNDNYALSFETNATERLQLTNDGRGLSQFTAKAWINFDGNGIIAINDSHNVSSITDDGTGKYQISFSTSMANNLYCCVGTVTAFDASNIAAFETRRIGDNYNQGNNTAYNKIGVRKEGGTYSDTDSIRVLYFGD